jgi:hypothetical protein
MLQLGTRHVYGLLCFLHNLIFELNFDETLFLRLLDLQNGQVLLNLFDEGDKFSNSEEPSEEMILVLLGLLRILSCGR